MATRMDHARMAPVKSGSSLLIGLISYWKLNEASDGSGAVQRNDSAGVNHLIDSDNVPSGAGVLSNCVSFTAASTQDLFCNDNAALTTGDIDFTISCWVNLATKTAAMGAVSKFTSAGGVRGEYLLNWDTAFMKWAIITATDVFKERTAVSLGSPPTATWIHIICYHDSVNNQIGIRCNGGTTDTLDVTGFTPSDTDAPFNVGRSGPALQYWNGLIDEVGFWKRMLMPTEQLELYNGGVGKTYPF